jgi:hypothetical protein
MQPHHFTHERRERAAQQAQEGSLTDLTRAEPQGPIPCRVFAQDRKESFKRAKHGAVDDDRALLLATLGCVPQVKALRQLKIQLNRRCLVVSSKRITQGHLVVENGYCFVSTCVHPSVRTCAGTCASC